MKATSFFGFTSILLLSLHSLLSVRPVPAAPAPPAWNEQTLSGKTVYYFIEAQCADCTPAEGRAAGKYLVVTPGISTAEYEDHADLLEKFRVSLATQFPAAPGLRDGLTFSFHFTSAEAETMRQAELEQKRAAGYEILELSLPQ